MPAMRIYDHMKRAFQETVGPNLHAPGTGESRCLDGRIAALDGVQRELRTAIEIRERLARLEARQQP